MCRRSTGSGRWLIELRGLRVFFKNVREAETHEALSLETRQSGKRFGVLNSDPVVLHDKQIVGSKLAQCPVDVRDAEPEGITDQFLREGHGIRASLCQSDNL